MWVALVGPDGAGKTTLAGRVADTMGLITERPVERYHMGKPQSPDTAFEENLARYRHYALTDNVVFDRLHFGCPVYGPIYRPEHDLEGYGELTAAQWRYTELCLASIGAATVMITADPELLAERLVTRGDDYVKTKDVYEICARYEWLASQSITLLPMRVDPVAIGEDSTMRRVMQIIRVAQIRADWATRTGLHEAYVGDYEPYELIIVPTASEDDVKVQAVTRAGDTWKHIGIVEEYRADEAIALLQPNVVTDLS